MQLSYNTRPSSGKRFLLKKLLKHSNMHFCRLAQPQSTILFNNRFRQKFLKKPSSFFRASFYETLNTVLCYGKCRAKNVVRGIVKPSYFSYSHKHKKLISERLAGGLCMLRRCKVGNALLSNSYCYFYYIQSVNIFLLPLSFANYSNF